MRFGSATVIWAALAGLTLATSAFAGPVPMAQNAHINDELRAGFAGDVLRNTCPTISARMLVVMGRLWDLKSYDEAAAYLAAAGAKPDDVESYCAVGEAEIAQKTPVGTLLRSSR